MKVLVLGATGRTGLLLVQNLLSHEHEVVAVTRKPKKLATHPNLEVIQGPPDQIESDQVAGSYDAVISALNVSRSTDFPWSPIVTPLDIFVRSWDNILARVNAERIIFLSAWGVGETRNTIPRWFRWMIEYSNIRHPYQAHNEQEEYFRKSGYDWTAIRPVGLINGPARTNLLISENDTQKMNLTISRSSVARFAVRVLEEKLYHQRAVNISS